MIEKYEKIIGEDELYAIYKVAERLKDFSILHINSTKAGGGVAEILNRMVPLMKDLGLNVDWKVIRGEEDFFKVTKSFHNSLQNGVGVLPEKAFETYDKWQAINASEVPLDYDIIMIHDPQPLGLIDFKKKGKWIFRCHIDISNPYPPVWDFLKKRISKYNAMVISAPAFARDDVDIPQFLIPPSIDPLSVKNKPLKEITVRRILHKYGINDDKPLVVQVSRFDYAKDPVGAIKAFKEARKHLGKLQLAYVGSPASDDPEGQEVYEKTVKEAENDRDIYLLMLPPYSDLEINAFQTGASVVMQKSIKEGFGLTVSEAMWKGKVVIGGRTGGIPLQIIHGITGYLVNSIEGAAHYIIHTIKNADQANEIGERARIHVKNNFLITRHMTQYMETMLYVTERTMPEELRKSQA
ncbi:glycosyl transferase family 1 [Candidatus Acidianus copahuensis]|uniref:Glycosyl transferase family 1 n=1 Tax=Candidatus Acidianus copahuensis TaxID=1160895 RepID=A0A031LNJ4_9CREN|nr:glycosyltransferase [Candidatus Acidianus copahuensis]EZQ06576.1 glycosyl transferase family 1 [Candidatus Acidianus copahuensis]